MVIYMRKTASRIAAAVMAAAMALGFSSCGGKSAAIASKEHIFSAQQIKLPEGLDYMSTVLFSNDKLYIIGDKSTQEGEGETATYKSETKMQIVTIDGTLEKEIVLSSNDYSQNQNTSKYINSTILDNDGNPASIEVESTWSETESSEKYFLVRYDSNGDVASRTDLEKLKEESMKSSGNDYFYVETFLFANDGTILFSSNGTITAADSEGKFLYTVKNENASDNSRMYGLMKAGDGRIFTSVTTSKNDGENYTSETKLCEIDTVNRKLGAEYPFEQAGSPMNGTEKYDLLISKDSGLAGYDIETGETEMIIDWLKSGFDNTAMECTTVLPDGRILCVSHDYDYHGGGGYGWSDDDLMANILTEVDPSTLPDRKLIKIYALYLDIGVKRQILEFNKNNPEYEIELTSYDEYAVNNYQDAITKLNNDMIAGNLPDIIVLESSMPVDSYISKGLLADLYEFMDNDETMNRSDYVESVFKAFEVDGKLYELVPSFYVNTIVGKTSQVGETAGWTVDEFISFVDANPDKSVFGAEMSRAWFFSSMINSCYGNFVNKETGECSFNSDDFIKLLEFSNRFPKEIDYDNLYNDDSFYMEQQSQYRDGKTLLNMQTIQNFSQMRELEQGAFGEPITFKGYPGAGGNGASFTAYSEIAITSKAANPEGAWAFVKYFLSDEYQDIYADRNSWQFPVKLSSLQKKAETAKERPYWEDAEGNKEYYDNRYWIGDTEINIGVNTDEDNQKVMDLINSTTNVSRYDRDISKIIDEEAAPFFEGQKSAQEVAEIIQNRVSNYIAENR